MDGKPRLLGQASELIYPKHYSIRTEFVYCELVEVASTKGAGFYLTLLSCGK
jgi:hypothetical protein